jgi:hypothetical protein
MTKLIFLLIFFLITTNLFSQDKTIEKKLENSINITLPKIKQGPNLNYNRNCPNCTLQESIYKVTDVNESTAKLDSPTNKQNIELSVLSLEKAQALFEKLTSQKDIPFAYAKDGCFSRAHKMAMILDEEKILSGKAFMQGKFYAQTISGPIFWTYHVAPIVLVKIGEEIKPYVFDPSMFKNPVPVSEWKQGLSRSPKSMFLAEYFTNRFSYDLLDKDKNLENYTDASISSMNSENAKFLDYLPK